MHHNTLGTLDHKATLDLLVILVVKAYKDPKVHLDNLLRLLVVY